MSDFCGIFLAPGADRTDAARTIGRMLVAYGDDKAPDPLALAENMLLLGLPGTGTPPRVDSRIVRLDSGAVFFGDCDLWQPDVPGARTPVTDLRTLGAFLDHGGTPERLNGDFAVGIADPATHSLTFYRDQIGMKTLCYARRPEGLWFATNLRFFHGTLATNAALSPLSLAAFYLMRHPGAGRTMFDGIEELEAAHALNVVDGRVVSCKRYWSLAATPNPGPLSRDAAYALIGKRLTRAVSARLGDATTPGTALSGGLDSTNVTALAKAHLGDRALHAFSHIAPEIVESANAHDDRPFIRDAVAHIGGLAHHWVTSDHIDVLTGAREAFDGGLQPTPDPFFHGSLALYQAAAQRGVDVYLDGMFGDHAFSAHGDPLLVQAALRADLGTMSRELSRRSRQSGKGLVHTVKGGLIRPLTPMAAVNLWRRSQGRHWTQTHPLRRDWHGDPNLAAVLARSRYWADIQAERSMASDIANQIQDPWVAWTSANRTLGIRGTGVRVRSPLADIDLLSALYWTDYRYFSDDTHDRAPARYARAHLLPPSVRERRTKDAFSPAVHRRTSDTVDRVIDDLTSARSACADVLDVPRIVTELTAARGRGQVTTDQMFRLILLPTALSHFCSLVQGP